MKRILRAVRRPLLGAQSTEELEQRVEIVEHIVEGLDGRVAQLEQERATRDGSDNDYET